ncbi:hypothetical protein BCR42DRAFT_453057 [Absidia repens]|uniref:protein S-acyltransferase n=1 Tax=Absidia repens TaxID=90262 RepID=A0A1X2ICA0_9FUNG|nr:hypothetical protein BCR42DRAFT_453057 [Absidia repens]
MPSSFDSHSRDNTQAGKHTSPGSHTDPSEPASALGDMDHSDQVMDMFLQQVTEYNTHQLAFDNELTNTNDLNNSHFFHTQTDPSDSTPQDLSHILGLENHSLTDTPTSSSSSTVAPIVQDHQQALEQTVKESSSISIVNGRSYNSNNKRNAKQKTKEGSSLLHVFTNPLLHAIPMLARNCLNFEDFLTQAAVQGRQNGLLGPKDGNKINHEFTSPDSLLLDCAGDNHSLMSKHECPWHVKVLGLPSSGAKSRVETQIKIVIQLVNSTGDLATTWSHLKLPEYMVARDKLKKRNQNKTTTSGEIQPNDDKSDMTDADVLKLEAAVVCDGHADNEIIMCSSCVHRERKRTKRKRDNKVARAANKEGCAAKLAALFAHELPDLSNENVMAEERKKILLFNCNEYVEFSNGEATLPTRVTCYCRHHSEKVGFRIVFTVKDSHNHVLGTGRSPPIMITDDHKSSKIQSATPAPQAPPIATNRKRSRNDDALTDLQQPPSSKRKMPNNTEVESDSGVSSPFSPTTPVSNTDEAATVQRHDDDRFSKSPSPCESQSIAAGSGQHYGVAQEKPTSHKQTTPQKSDASSTFMDSLHQGELYDFLNSNDLNMDNITPMSSVTSHHQQFLDLQQPRQQHRSSPINRHRHEQRHQQPMISMMQQQEQLLTHMSRNSLQNMSNRRRTTASHLHQQSTNSNNMADNVYSKMLQKRQTTENNNTKTSLPRLHRLIPSEGPIYGGSEVTVLGSNFYEGLTCLFGENPAIPTHCWSANTLLCILPPALSAGPVVVSFKEHPLMLESQDVVLFTYFDESDRALMELALQVVGLKTMGKVEDARQIAMRIVQGGGKSHQRRSNSHRSSSSTSKTTTTTTRIVATARRVSYRHFLTAKAAKAAYDNAHMLFYTRLEEQVIAALVAANSMKNDDDVNDASRLWIKNCISLTNENQHTLLHLAAIRGYDRLVRILVHLDCDVDQTDRNGFTALHFASWTGKLPIVNVLLDRTDWRIETVTGKTALQLAFDAGHHNVVALFRQKSYQQQQQQQQQHELVDTDAHYPSSLPLSYRKRSTSRASSTLSYTTTTSSLSSSSSSMVRVPLIDILPSSAAVSSAKSILPEQLFNMLSSVYIISINTPCVQQLSQSVSTVYTSMLDPF